MDAIVLALSQPAAALELKRRNQIVRQRLERSACPERSEVERKRLNGLNAFSSK
jgi:hypothetical protein